VWYFKLTKNIHIIDHHFNKKKIHVGTDHCFDQNYFDQSTSLEIKMFLNYMQVYPATQNSLNKGQ
jgi:hypothetical protein